MKAHGAAAPRVLVGCPTFDGKSYALESYAHMVKSFSYPSYDILIVDNSAGDEYLAKLRRCGLPAVKGPHLADPKDRLVASRNILREVAIKEGYDYLLSLEQDVIAPADTITRLVGHHKEYVTTVVMNRGVFEGKQVTYPMVCVPWEGHPGKLRYIRMEDIRSGKLFPVRQAHLACTLISTAALRRIAFRHEGKAFDDTMLCQDLLALGTPLYCDPVPYVIHRPNASFQRLELGASATR